VKTRLLVLAAVVAAAAACYTGSPVDNNNVPGMTPTVDTSPTDPTGGGNGNGATDTTTAVKLTGLPCDLALLLQTSCGDCHGKKPANNATTTILSYDDLVAKSDKDPTKTVADIALARMEATKKPMPPDGKLGSDEIAILAKWIQGGMPRGSCGTSDDSPDAGGHGTVDAGNPNAQPPPPVAVCTSKVTADPNEPGEEMHPGNACITCHTDQGGPSFTVAGTVYPTVHEPDECNGIDGTTGANLGTEVLIIDANGNLQSLPVDDAGNFFSKAALPTPYRAMVVRGNSIKEMRATQTDGDCNNCHTKWGDGSAPGRVMAP
jgi:mono/diheme cytochrome c family protein